MRTSILLVAILAIVTLKYVSAAPTNGQMTKAFLQSMAYLKENNPSELTNAMRTSKKNVLLSAAEMQPIFDALPPYLALDLLPDEAFEQMAAQSGDSAEVAEEFETFKSFMRNVLPSSVYRKVFGGLGFIYYE